MIGELNKYWTGSGVLPMPLRSLLSKAITERHLRKSPNMKDQEPMQIREIMDLIQAADETTKTTPEELHRVIGDDLKELLKRTNLQVIDSVDLADHIMRTIDRVYTRQGVPQPISIAAMYGADDRDEELDLAKKTAEVAKIRAQAAKIEAERSAEQ